MSAALSLAPQDSRPQFVVRDLSAVYGMPAFDIVFCDREFGTVRCSDKLWSSYAQAELDAQAMERRNYRPLHWSRLEHWPA